MYENISNFQQLALKKQERKNSVFILKNVLLFCFQNENKNCKTLRNREHGTVTLMVKTNGCSEDDTIWDIEPYPA
jgi:hypothetical protein